VRAKSVRKDFDILRWSLGTCGMIKLLQVIEDEDEIGDFHGDPKVGVQDLLNKLPAYPKCWMRLKYLVQTLRLDRSGKGRHRHRFAPLKQRADFLKCISGCWIADLPMHTRCGFKNGVQVSCFHGPRAP